jgi:hypothetical protein
VAAGGTVCLRIASSLDRILDDLAIIIKASQKSFPVSLRAYSRQFSSVLLVFICIFHTRRIDAFVKSPFAPSLLPLSLRRGEEIDE